MSQHRLLAANCSLFPLLPVGLGKIMFNLLAEFGDVCSNDTPNHGVINLKIFVNYKLRIPFTIFHGVSGWAAINGAANILAASPIISIFFTTA